MVKKEEYRLKTLFEMREREKKSAEEIYAEKKKISVEEKNKLDTMQQKLVDMLKFREEKNQEYSNQIAAGEIKIEQVQIKNNHIKHLKEEEEAFKLKIEDQKQVLAQAEEVTKEALQAMLKATQEYKAIEKHKANFEKAEKIKIAKAQEDEADDISQAKYFAKLKERGGQ